MGLSFSPIYKFSFCSFAISAVELLNIVVRVLDIFRWIVFFVYRVLSKDSVSNIVFSIDGSDVIEVCSSPLSMFLLEKSDVAVFNIRKKRIKMQ